MTQRYARLFTMALIAICGTGIVPGIAMAGGLLVTDLGTIGTDPISTGQAINASGMVAVNAETFTPSFRGDSAVYSGGTLTPLGTSSGLGMTILSLNDQGDAVGSSTTAFYYNHSTQMFTSLGTLGGLYSYAEGINNSDVVVGYSTISTNGPYHAFEYVNGQMKDLGALVPGGQSYADAINSAGYIAGSAYTAQNTVGYPEHAVLIDPSGTFHDLGALGTGQLSEGLAINSSNEVVGVSTLTATDFTTEHAFAYVNGQMVDLGTLGGTYSVANGVNDSGVVVGASYLSGTTNEHAFVYENGSMIDLNSLLAPNSGWTLISANAINDAGQITGIGINGSGQEHAFLLQLSSVPEPGSFVLLAVGAGLALGAARMRRSRGL
jgi:probable HAF family extracellular repeat protein